MWRIVFVLVTADFTVPVDKTNYGSCEKYLTSRIKLLHTRTEEFIYYFYFSFRFAVYFWRKNITSIETETDE